MNPLNSHHSQILIVGGGTAGITVAAQLRAAAPQLSITLIEPSGEHYYQPLWTLVGGGVGTKAATERPEASLIPNGVRWVKDAVASFEPQEHQVTTHTGGRYSYEQLVVCPGIQVNWHLIKGLPETLGKNGVCSNYSYAYLDATWANIRCLRAGNALFTLPATPVKCAGAPQKIMYLAEDHFRRAGVRDQVRVAFHSASPTIFGVAKYRAALEKVVAQRGIETHFRRNLVEVDGPARRATFADLDTSERVTVPFDLLHVAPPMSAPDFIRASPLADKDGWAEADKHTLQHPRFADVFALGDASSLPTSRTGAAVRKQAPVLVKNLLAHRAGLPLTRRYDGYTSCPLITGYGKLILAEFDYEGNPAETFPFDQSKERYSMWLLKRFGLPLLYWQGMLKGRA